jgi:putative transcriptional regulator
VVFVGGPVEQQRAVALLAVGPHGAPGVPGSPDIHGDEAATSEATAWHPVGGGIATLDLGSAPEALGPHVGPLRVFAGYAGWGPGQLEGEIAAGGWFVVDARPEDAFSHDPAALWRSVLRRQPGRLALFGLYPDDPSAN